MALTREEVTSFREGTWRLECPTLRLVRQSKTKPHNVSGAGEIRLSPDHVLRLKLYGWRAKDQQQQPKEMFEEARELPAGSLRPDDSYYSLEAVDFNGRRWSAERLIPDISHSAIGKPIAEADLPSIQMETDLRQHSAGRSLVLHVFEKVTIPTNATVREETSIAAGTRRQKRYGREAWKFRACKIDFLIVSLRQDELQIHADTTAVTTGLMRERITEALQFLLGRPLPWSVSIEASSGRLVTELRSRVWRPPKARHHPPLQPFFVTEEKGRRTRLTARHHRRLFERFLRHTLGTEVLRHPLWGDLNAVYEASAGRFIDAHALTLAVVIEALLAREFPNLGAPNAKLRKGVAEVRTLVNKSKLAPEVRSRIKGALGVLLSNSATSRLRELVDKGAITRQQQQSWRDLRNAITHAYQSSSLSSAELRQLLRVNEVLFTHLIFCAIGYRGLYTDYSSLGWPNRVYPPESP